MARRWRGITMVGYLEKEKKFKGPIIKRNNKVYPLWISKKGLPNILTIKPVNNSWEGWIGNQSVDKDKEGSITPLWNQLMKGEITEHDLVKELLKDKKVKVRKIDMFECNKNIVNVSDIYSFNSNCYCLFLKDRKSFRLLEVGCKTIKEVKAVRQFNSKVMNVPLIISVNKEKKYSILNPI